MIWKVRALYSDGLVENRQGDLSMILGSIDDYTKTSGTKVVSLVAKRIRDGGQYVN